MRILVFVLLCVPLVESRSLQEVAKDWTWAFPAPNETPPVIVDDTPLKQVPGSAQIYDRPRIDPFNPPDWFPDEHPLMPPVVRHGSGKSAQACSYCHLASGCGHPQSANLAGLPVTYFMRQIADFKSGARTAPPMDSIAKGLSDDDAQQASQWFASLKPSPWVKVVETETAPRTFVLTTRLRLPVPGGGIETLGDRIIEVPQEPSRALSYDPHSGFVAYVPLGSIARGEKLVTTGGAGKTIACITCHGETLRGSGDVPRIAGRSPIYIVRQLFDIQTGTRAGAAAELMKPVVMNLDQDDMVAIAAYVASRAP
jgi:cytochrome c553